MTARRETIIAAVFTRLQTVPGLALCRRMPNAEPSEFPALDLDDRGQQVLDRDAQQTRYAMTLVVEGRVQGTGGTAAHQALNTLYAATVRALLADIQLGGLCDDIREEDTSIDVSALAQSATLAFATAFTIEFTARTYDPDLS